MAVTIDDVRAAARRLGLAGLSLCVHSSLRSFGWVEGGARTVVDGLLAERCTVLVPAQSWSFAVAPQAHQRPARNAWDYDRPRNPLLGAGRIYSPDSAVIDRANMGAVPAHVVTRSDRFRGSHPLFSFAAVGPDAARLIGGQAALDIFAPLRMLADAGGSVLLMGVGLERMTLLHLAEQMAGRTLFRRWANGPDGQPIEAEVGGCSDGFPKLEAVLAPLASETTVGASRWRAFPVLETLAATADAIRRQPEITRCSVHCERCRDAIVGGPILDVNPH